MGHWRNNNGRSFTVRKVRENRVGAISAVTNAAGLYEVTYDEDIHGMTVIANEFVAVHNIPNARISQSVQIKEGIADDFPLVRGQQYDMGCRMIALESQDAGKNLEATFNVVSGTCSPGKVSHAHYPANQVGNVANPSAAVTFTGSATITTSVGGASDTIMESPGSTATLSGDFTQPTAVIDGITTLAAELTYANAYYGVGGDMLVVDSKPDAIRGGSAIAMDITYTGPSGSCSVEEVTKGSKESAVCSNRGVCDYETGTCVCAEGFMKEACSEQSVLV